MAARKKNPATTTEKRPALRQREEAVERRESLRGPLLTVAAAAAIVGQTPAAVRQAIAARLLRARRSRGERVIGRAELRRYQRALAEDVAAIRARQRQRLIPGDQVHAELGI